MKAPGPKKGALGSLLALRRDPLRFLEDLHATHGDAVAFHLGPRLCHLFAGAEDVRFVLRAGHAHFQKNPHYTRTMGQAMGQGLITSEGDLHRRQRRIAQVAFRRERIRRSSRIVQRGAHEMVEGWEMAARAGTAIDLTGEMSALALDVAMRTIFGEPEEPAKLALVAQAMKELNHDLNQELFSVFRLPRWIPTPANRRFSSRLGLVERSLLEMIARHRRSGVEGDDLLSILSRARDPETGEAMSDRQLRDELVTFFAASHETSASALTWAAYLLATHPKVAGDLRDELRGSATGGPDDDPDEDRWDRSELLERVCQEAMRVYPPVYLFDRVSLDDVAIGGVDVPRGSTVYLSQWLTHHHPEYWERPKAFDPDHFLPDRVAARPSLAFFPFGAGPRQCIGADYAFRTMQVVLGTIVERFDLEMVSARPPVPVTGITLQPPAGLLAKPVVR